MNGSSTLNIESRYSLMIVATIGAALWIWFIIKDRKDEMELERY